LLILVLACGADISVRVRDHERAPAGVGQ